VYPSETASCDSHPRYLRPGWASRTIRRTGLGGPITSIVDDRGETSGPNASNYQYAYDPNGNICRKNTGTAIANFRCTSTGSTVTTYTPNNVNELNGTGYSYDANGNETGVPGLGCLVYNALEQTTSIAGKNATYGGVGQFQRLSFNGDAFFDDQFGVGRWTSGTTSIDFTRDPAGTELGQTDGSNTYYYAFDGLGSVVGLFDSGGNLVSGYLARYEPYGKLVNPLPNGYPALPLRFAGYWYDTATGLYKVGTRYYNPTDQRWLQRDPLDNPTEPSGWNRYIYAGDDPINNSDPSGMKTGALGGGTWRQFCADWFYFNNGFNVRGPAGQRLCGNGTASNLGRLAKACVGYYQLAALFGREGATRGGELWVALHSGEEAGKAFAGTAGRLNLIGEAAECAAEVWLEGRR
jgi:RHS repeat-associated protein